MPKQKQRKTPLVSLEEAKRRHDLMDRAILAYHGTAEELEGAIGAYMIARHIGWKVLFLIHTKRTIAKYEAILGIRFRDEFLELTEDSDRANVYRVMLQLSNFWKAVSGDEKLPLERAERRSLT